MKRLRQLRKKYGSYLFITIACVVTYILLLQVIVPTATQTLNNYRLWEEKKAQLVSITKKRTMLESVTEATLQLLGEAEAALPSEKDVATILVTMENLAQITTYGVNNISLTPGVVSTESATLARGEDAAGSSVPDPAGKRKGADFLPVYISTTGTTAQFLEFISHLQGSRRVLDIESINAGYAGGDSNDQLTAQFNLIAYYLPPINSLGRIDSELPNFTEEEQKLLKNLVAMPVISATLLGQDAGIPVSTTGKANLFTR